jgi:hypothetical protein
MMAARAGAKQVTTCEESRSSPSGRGDYCGLNGLTDRISVVNKRSSQLTTGAGSPNAPKCW